MNNTKRDNVISLRSFLYVAFAILVMMMLAGSASGMIKIRDVARPLGERNNKLWQMSLVVGLNGTGDGGDVLVTVRSLAGLLQNIDDQVTANELKNAKNVALVMVTATVGRNGFRDGDEVDVQVASLGSAKSVAGGRLIPTPLQSFDRNDDRLYAWASGRVTVPDASSPTTGVIKNGAVLEEDFLYEYINFDHNGKATFTLVMDEDQASFQATKRLAMTIDEILLAPGEELGITPPIAIPLDGRSICVYVPPKYVHNPTRYIAHVMNIQIEMPDPEAVVVVNERTGTICFTGNVEISPIVVTVDGMLVRLIDPKPKPKPGVPVVRETQWGAFDTAGNAVSISELIEELDQLNVPVQSKINVLYEIHRAGALRARLVTE